MRSSPPSRVARRAALALAIALTATGATSVARADGPQPGRAPSASTFTPAQRALFEFAAGAAVSLVAVPSSVAVGSLLGQSSGDLVVAALPAALTFLAVPTVSVTLAEVHVANGLAPGSARFSPAFFSALGVDVLALALGAVGGVSPRDGLGLTLFTLATSVVMPGAVTLTLHFTQPRALRAAGRRPGSRIADAGDALDAPAYLRASEDSARRERPTALNATIVPVFSATF